MRDNGMGTRITIGRKIWAGFIGTLLLVLVVGGVAWQVSAQLVESGRWVAHTHQVIARLEDLLSLVKDVETGGRGYVVTGDEKFLEPLIRA
jgi:CHASE3 domain sensor protein